MARPKRTDLDEVIDRFTDLDSESRNAWLSTLIGIDRSLSRREGKQPAKANNQPMLELGERAVEDKELQ